MSFAKFSKTLITVLLLGAFAAGSAFGAAQRSAKKEVEKREPQYPNATRVEPKIKQVASLNKQVQKLYDLSQDDRADETIELADQIIGNSRAGAYERSIAHQAKAFAYMDKDDYGSAIPEIEKTLEANGLPNDNHYQMMLQLANMYLGEEQYQDALRVMDQFLAETKSDKPEHLAMKGNALYRLERFDEAAELLKRAIAASDKPQDSWSQLLMASYFDQDKPLEAAKIAEELLAKNPNDKRMMMNLSSIYAEADMYDKAAEVLEGARSKGLLTEDREYRQLYAIYLNSEGKENKGIEVINEGLEKGILKPSPEVYIALGQSYYFTDRIKESIEAYRKALPLATNGEPALNLARVLTNEEDYAGAKAAAQEALKKGVRRPGDAWMIIGRAEFGLNNRPALIAAYKEAAKYPETQQQASEWLRKNAK